MKRKIMLFFSVLTVFILMIVPSISAIEYNEIVNENESRLKNTLLDEKIEDLKIRILSHLERIENNFDEDIWSILWEIINDIIGAIVICITFKFVNMIFLLLIPPFISILLVMMMKLIKFGVYCAILFDIVRNIFILFSNIISPSGSFFCDCVTTDESNLIRDPILKVKGY